jgi:hypothetical protein
MENPAPARSWSIWAVVIGPVIAGLTIGIVLLILPWAYRQTFPGEANRTEVRLFRPLEGETLAANLHVIRYGVGECYLSVGVPGSPETGLKHFCFATVRYRALAFGTCWERDWPEKVICVENPWTRSVTAISVRDWIYSDRRGRMRKWSPRSDPTPRHLPSKGPLPHSLSQAIPWALELSNGEHCVSFAMQRPINVDDSYWCKRGGVVGYPDRTREPWLVSFARYHSSEIIQVKVTAAWF